MFNYGDKVFILTPEFFENEQGIIVDYYKANAVHPNANRLLIMYDVKMKHGNIKSFNELNLELAKKD